MESLVNDLITFLIEGWEDYYASFADALDFVTAFAASKDIEIDREEIRQKWSTHTGL